METTSYVLGMLTIYAVALTVTVVVGIVKILKLSKQLNQHITAQREEAQHIYHIVGEEASGTNNRLTKVAEDLSRDISMVDKTLQNKMENELKGVHTNTKRYIDSRLDKLIDTYFGVVGAKEIIKG